MFALHDFISSLSKRIKGNTFGDKFLMSKITIYLFTNKKKLS